MDPVAAVFPEIKPHDCQFNVAEALALGLDVTVTDKTLPRALLLLPGENCNEICLVISPLNEVEVDPISSCGHNPRRVGPTLKTTFSLLRFRG